MSTMRISRLARFVATAIWLAGCTPADAASLKPDEVVAKHLDSLGTTAARAAAKNRLVQGTAQFKILVGGSALLDGTVSLVSEDRKLQLLLKFDNGNYRGERLICDGDKVEISATTARQLRSPFGEFVRSQDVIVREGLLTGVLSTAWPLLNLEDRKPKLTYEGIKKLNGTELHDIQYHPKKSSGDLEIHLYFDPVTFRHMATVYRLAHGTLVGEGPTTSVQQKETRYEIKEQFSDFKTAEGLTVPSREVIQYTQENQDGSTLIWEWDLTLNEVSDNIRLDPRNFATK
jgi:hypothetical protein